jgi:hypothetical protein
MCSLKGLVKSNEYALMKVEAFIGVRHWSALAEAPENGVGSPRRSAGVRRFAVGNRSRPL